MQSEDFWRACDTLSIFQAIMLILGYNPENLYSNNIHSGRNKNPPIGYDALKTTILKALKNGQIVGNVHIEEDDYGNSYLCIDESDINVNSLKTYLRSKNLTDNFFFHENETSEEYLNPNNPYYTSKIAAAVSAWKAVTSDANLLKSKTPKQAIKKWLEENAEKFNLKKEDGTYNIDAIENIAKLCNWKPEGGAAKTGTPIQVSQTHAPPKNIKKLKDFGVSSNPFDDLSDDIPF